MPDRFEIACAGVTFEGRQEIIGNLHRWQEEGKSLSAALDTEPTNRFDPNAIRVLVLGEHIGYVPKVIAAKLASRLRKGEVATVVEVRILRGGDLPGYGARVLVDVGEPAPVLTDEERGGF